MPGVFGCFNGFTTDPKLGGSEVNGTAGQETSPGLGKGLGEDYWPTEPLTSLSFGQGRAEQGRTG